MRMIKAILIDPFEKTVSEVQLDGDDYRAIYPLISRPEDQVDTFTSGLAMLDGDMVLVDDEGLINWWERGQAFFEIIGGHQPLAGKGLVMGSNTQGESTSVRVTLGQMQELVRWVDEADVLKWIGSGS